jgi:hypothetical protein
VYIFALIAILLGGLWLLIERGPPGLVRRLARYGTLTFGIFAILTGAFWVLSPAATGRLVPGHSTGEIVAAVVQARGGLVFVLGAVALVARDAVHRSWRNIWLGPLVYNILLFSEALHAQFTLLKTPERWLYVALHLFWVLSFAIRLSPQVEAPGKGAKAAPKASRAGGVLLAFCIVALAVGVLCFAAPGLLPSTSASQPDPFLIHALHALGSASMAVAAVALATYDSDSHEHLIGLGAALTAMTVVLILALAHADSLST